MSNNFSKMNSDECKNIITLDCSVNENHEKINKMLKEIQAEDKANRDLIMTDKYINWLESFTKNYPSFCDDDWLYKKDELSKTDYENVTKLSKFQSSIESVISTTPDIEKYFMEFYVKIKHGDIGYKITTIIGQSAVTSCERVDSGNLTDFYDIKEIREKVLSSDNNLD